MLEYRLDFDASSINLALILSYKIDLGYFMIMYILFRWKKLATFYAMKFLEFCYEICPTFYLNFRIYLALMIYSWWHLVICNCVFITYLLILFVFLGSSLKSADGLGSSKLSFSVNSTRKPSSLSKALTVKASYRYCLHVWFAVPWALGASKLSCFFSKYV